MIHKIAGDLSPDEQVCEWSLEVDEDGDLRIYCNGHTVAHVNENGFLCLWTGLNTYGLPLPLDDSGRWKEIRG